jgi:bifunctional N-acetylglucosamine-1-phosphate-uridyltransferase/glucosamine-1-phosphate-acetyltransferase GlmU-like protein
MQYRRAGLPGRAAAQLARQLTRTNAQEEYYLTDVIALAVRQKTRVQPLLARSRRRSWA